MKCCKNCALDSRTESASGFGYCNFDVAPGTVAGARGASVGDYAMALEANVGVGGDLIVRRFRRKGVDSNETSHDNQVSASVCEEMISPRRTLEGLRDLPVGSAMLRFGWLTDINRWFCPEPPCSHRSSAGHFQLQFESCIHMRCSLQSPTRTMGEWFLVSEGVLPQRWSITISRMPTGALKRLRSKRQHCFIRRKCSGLPTTPRPPAFRQARCAPGRG